MAKSGKWLSFKEVAGECCVSERTLRRWKKAGEGPPLFQFGRRYFGWPREIQTWIEGQRR
jgi:predicted DNA-binding transcriptional regulator AlpA